MRPLVLSLAAALAWAGTSHGAECKTKVDPSKVVVFLGFHGNGEELAGAKAGACARGETLLALPPFSAEFERLKATEVAAEAKIGSLSAALNKALAACEAGGKGACAKQNRITEDLGKAQLAYEAAQSLTHDWVKKQPMQDIAAAFKDELKKMHERGAAVTALVLSGHDGGGKFYGDFGTTGKPFYFELANEFPGEMQAMTSIHLMGCWSAVPKEINDWQSAYPNLTLIAGFVGSAPSSVRKAAAESLFNTLTLEKKLAAACNEAKARSVLAQFKDINGVTTGLYFRPQCSATPFYYVSTATTKEESAVRGLNRYGTESLEVQRQKCAVNLGKTTASSVDKYFYGNAEPGNLGDLRSLYSRYRNNETCFNLNGFVSRYNSDQVFFLRFFQGTKKNFNKYFGASIQEAYSRLDQLVQSFPPGTLPGFLLDFYRQTKSQPLYGDFLLKMNRWDTLDAISKFATSEILIMEYAEKAGRAVPAETRRLLSEAYEKLNTHLFELKCMDPTWHEYKEGVPLVPPTCSN